MDYQLSPPPTQNPAAAPLPRNTPILGAPPLVTSPQTINFPPVDYTKTAAQTGFPQSILPRGGNGAADMDSLTRYMQKTSPNYSPPPGVGAQVGGAALKTLGVASLGYGGFVDYQNGIAQGESQFRSGTNAVAGVGGAIVGGQAGVAVGTPIAAAVGAAFPPAAPVTVPLTIFASGTIGSIAGSGITGWLSDRVLDLFGGPKGIPNPNGPSGNPFAPADPFGSPKTTIPQPTAQNPGPPPGGGGVGMPKGNPANPNTGAPTTPLLPWLPDWKMPRMPWDPPVPGKPADPKKPSNPGNPGKPDAGKPKPKPTPPPLKAIPGNWVFTTTSKQTGEKSDGNIGGFSTDKISQVRRDRPDGATSVITNYQRTGETESTSVSTIIDHLESISYRFVATPTPENTKKKPPVEKKKPATPPPRGTLTPPSQPIAQNSPGAPQSPQSPGFTPSINPSSPGNLAPFLGGNQGGFVPGLYQNPNYTPPKNDGTPEKKPGTPPGGEVQPDGTPRFPGFRPVGEPTLQPAPSTSPAVNQPGVNTPKPWTNPFFAPSSLTNGGSQVISPEVNPGKLNTGELNKGELNTGDQSGNTKWNSETKKYEPSFPGVTDPSQIKTPAASQNPAQTVGADKKASFTMPGQAIPTIPGIPAAAKIPEGAIPEPIRTPNQPAPSTSCNYRPDATVSVGLASYNPLTDTITYTPTVVSASNAAGFQHLAQETANMRKEVSGIHKVLEVDLYRSPTGKVVAPKAECEVLQGVMSVSPLAAVPLIKTLPQEMKVLAAMNHMYSGHHLLGRVQLPTNPMDTKAPTVSPLTTIGMMLNMYSNTIATVGLPSTISTVDAKGQTVLTPFRNATDAIETTNAHVQGLQTEMSGVMEMLFKVLQNQEMAINMIHKETYKTDVLIKDTGCRISEIAVKRPGVMTHGIKKPGSTAVFNWNTVFQGSTSYTSVPTWQGDIDKQQLGLKTNMEAQKANTSVYFPISGKGDSALPKLSKKSKKDKEWERYVKTVNEGIEGGIYHGPGMPESKIEEIKGGIVKKIVTDTVTFIGETGTTV